MSKIPSSRFSENKLTARPSTNKSNAQMEDKKVAEEQRMDEVFQNNFHIVTALLSTVTFRCKICCLIFIAFLLKYGKTFYSFNTSFRCRECPQVGY